MNKILIIALSALLVSCASVDTAKVLIKTAKLADSATVLKKSYANVRAAVLQSESVYTGDELLELKDANTTVQSFYDSYQAVGSDDLSATTAVDVAKLLGEIDDVLKAIDSMIVIVRPRIAGMDEDAKLNFYQGLTSYTSIKTEYDAFLAVGDRAEAIRTGLNLIQTVGNFL